MRRVASLFVLAVLAACEPTVPEGRFACERDDDCPDELVCRTRIGRCFATQVDAGPRHEDAAVEADGGRSDAAIADAGMDAGAGPADASVADASDGDAGADAGADAGS